MSSKPQSVPRDENKEQNKGIMAVSSENRSGTCFRGKTRRQEKHTTSKRVCDNFLTTRFEELPAYEIPTVTGRCGEIDLLALERQAKKFLHIYGRDVEFAHSGNPCKDILILTKLLQESLPEIEGIELVSIETINGEKRQEFIAYESVPDKDFHVMTIFLMPVMILEKVDEALRDIILDFFTYLDRKTPFIVPKSSVDMSYSLGVIDGDEDNFDEEIVENWGDEYRELAERYVKGDINAVFVEMDERRRAILGQEVRHIALIKEKIKNYRKTGKKFYHTPSGEKKSVDELFAAIEEGISLGQEDNLFNYELRSLRNEYGDHTFYEDIDTDEILDFDRQFLFSWGLQEEDDIIDDLMSNLNADAGNFSETTLLNTIRIAKCEKRVQFGDYPKRWYEWYIKILNCIYE